MITDTLREVICCPVDKGKLAKVGDKLKCERCKREYPIIDGIPVLLPPKDL
jgi:uncharacterized protein YbaR (Trm112 family)